MPLSPSPLMPGHSPLPNPGERPADRHALRLGALVAMVTLVAVLLTGQVFLLRLVFLTPGLLARASSSQGVGSGGPAFQGFSYVWTKRSGAGGGYATQASLQNMRSEHDDFHMNAVVIPIVADMPFRSRSMILWNAGDNHTLDTLPDKDYAQAASDAQKAGLEPIFELVLKQQDALNAPSEDSRFVGTSWFGLRSTQYIQSDGVSVAIGTLEHEWVDNYTAFAVHFAQLATAAHVHYFIIGDGLSNTTTDGNGSLAKTDPAGIAPVKGDTFDASKCSGRHECEWRHVIHAIRAPSYKSYLGDKDHNGANYAGKLIYAASWQPCAANACSGAGEFEGIQWWDAVDAIGVDAYFPLTQTSADLDPGVLIDAWHGRGADLTDQRNIYQRLQKVADQFSKLVLFTGAGYESTPGSNRSPGQTQSNGYDPNEQRSDMEALLATFSGAPWWIGVIWYADQPLAPRSHQSNWQTGTQWAGDNLRGTNATDSKPAGIWLAQHYRVVPAPCLC